jgi:hypothetical protein
MRKNSIAISVALALCTPFGAQAAGVTNAMIENGAKDTANVLNWGINQEGQRYSPLTQVNSKTVARLVPAWSFSFGGEKQRGQESQPLIYNGKMFVTGSYSRIFALDAKTGQKLWKYEHRLPDGIMPCCDVVNRGAALFDNLVIFSTLVLSLPALSSMALVTPAACAPNDADRARATKMAKLFFCITVSSEITAVVLPDAMDVPTARHAGCHHGCACLPTAPTPRRYRCVNGSGSACLSRYPARTCRPCR